MAEEIILNPTDYISEYATFSAVTKTATGFRNYPNLDILNNMKALCSAIYDRLCEHFKTTIKIAIFYRSPKVNAAAGADITSQHRVGEAVDIDLTETNGITIPNANAVMYEYIFNNLPFDQIIWEHGDGNNPDWVHVSYVSNERRENRRLLTIIPKKGKPLHSKTWEGFLQNKKIVFNSMIK